MRQSNGARLLCRGSTANDPDIDQLLHPSRFYSRPGDVVAADLLTVEERRPMLVRWNPIQLCGNHRMLADP
jgi:hypothetical protein